MKPGLELNQELAAINIFQTTVLTLNVRPYNDADPSYMLLY